MSLAAQTPALTTAAASVPSSGGASWFALVMLTLMVVLVAVVLWFNKRRLTFTGQNDEIRILSLRPLGAREQIVVARVYGRVLVLGHTPSQVSLLCELDPAEVPVAPTGPASGDFSQLISKFARKEGRP